MQMRYQFFLIFSLALMCQAGRILQTQITELPVRGLIVSQKSTMPHGVWRFNITSYNHDYTLGYQITCGTTEASSVIRLNEQDEFVIDSETIVCPPNEDFNIQMYNDSFSDYWNAKRSVGTGWTVSYPCNLTIVIEEKTPIELAWGSPAPFVPNTGDFFHVRTSNLSGYAYSNTPVEDDQYPFLTKSFAYTGDSPHFVFAQRGRPFLYLDTFTNPRQSLFAKDFYVYMSQDQKLTSFKPGAVPFVQNGTSMNLNYKIVFYVNRIVCAIVGTEPAHLSFSPFPADLEIGIQEYFPFHINETSQCIAFTKTDVVGTIQWRITYGKEFNLTDGDIEEECEVGKIFPFRILKNNSSTPVYATIRSRSGNSLQFGVQYKYRDISVANYWGSRICNASGTETFFAVEETPAVIDLSQSATTTLQFTEGQETILLKIITTDSNPTAFEWDYNNLPFQFNATGYPIAVVPVTGSEYTPTIGAFLVTNKNHYFVQVNNPNFVSFENGTTHFLEGQAEVSFTLNGAYASESSYFFSQDNQTNIIPIESFAIISVQVPNGLNCYRFKSDEVFGFVFDDLNSFNSLNAELFEIHSDVLCSRRNNVGRVHMLIYAYASNYTIFFDQHIPFSFDQQQTFTNSFAFLVLPPTNASYIYVNGAGLLSGGQLLIGRVKLTEVFTTYNSFIFLEGENVTVTVQTEGTPEVIQLCSSSDECNGFPCTSGTCDFPPPTSTSSSSSSLQASSTQSPASTTRFTSTVPKSSVSSASLTGNGKISEADAEKGLELVEKILLGGDFNNNSRRFDLTSVEYINSKRAGSVSTKVNFNVLEQQGSSKDSVTLLRDFEDLIEDHPDQLTAAGFPGAKLEFVSFNYGEDSSSSNKGTSVIGVMNIASAGETIHFILALLLVQIFIIT